jgi:hypothetical protein
VIASIALLVALAGTGYAATSLPKNSVGPDQLQANAVTSSKVKNHSLFGVDFAAGQLPRGPRGVGVGKHGQPGVHLGKRPEGSSQPVPLFELVLPPRAAKAAIPVLTFVTVAGIAAAVFRRPRR